tara:strand:+ start:129 stop:1163 length:1035 start_codon:yes stop_codon:yes gene_type:complete
MSKSTISVVSLLNLFKQKIILILFIFIISILSSYYYNNNIKYISYKYSLKFNIVNEWDIGKLKLSYDQFLDLTKGTILNLIKEYKPVDYNIDLEEKYQLYFELQEPVNVDNVVESLNNRINEKIIYRIKQKLNGLERKENLQKKNIKTKISQLKNERLVLNNNIKVAIEELTSSKKMIEEQFGYFLNMDFSDLDNIVDLADFRLQEAVYLKENYITLSNRIRMKEKLLSDLDRIDSSNSLAITEELISSEPEIYKLFKILQNISSLEDVLNSNMINDDIFELSQALDDFISTSDLSFYNISAWQITNNKFSNKEIILAGILFGLLINALILFLNSDYLRKSLHN